MKKYIYLALIVITLFVLTGCPKQIVNQAPTVTKITEISGTISNSSSTFSWSGNDSDGNITRYEYRKDGESWINNGTSTSYTWIGYEKGNHTFEVIALDNDRTYSIVISWNFFFIPSNQLPTVEKIAGIEGDIAQTSNVFLWSGSDSDGSIEKYEYKKDEEIWRSNGTSYIYNWSNYSEGEHTLKVRAQDNEGAYSEIISWSFNYDKPNEAPTVTKVSGVEGNTSQGSNTFEWSGNDTDGTISTYEYRKDSGNWESNRTSTTHTWSNYSEGSHTFEVRAKDNTGAYSEIISWSFIRIFPITVETVLVEAGIFGMGDEFGDLYDSCRPVHTVILTNDFELGEYELTNLEYVEFLNDSEVASNGSYNGKVLIAMDDSYCQIGHNGTEFYVENSIFNNYPVIEVSWWGAIEYCNWLNRRNGYAVAYDNSGNLLDKYGNITTDIAKVEGYRLPTEAEWEYAARGGKYHSLYKYSGSDNPDEVAWYTDNSTNPDNPMRYGKGTHEIGTKQSNVLGIYDMSGNVYEWCSDWSTGSYYSRSPSVNPYNYSKSSSRVIRGGNWGINATYIRVANRNDAPPAFTYDYIGFRFCRTISN